MSFGGGRWDEHKWRQGSPSAEVRCVLRPDDVPALRKTLSLAEGAASSLLHRNGGQALVLERGEQGRDEAVGGAAGSSELLRRMAS